MSNVTVIVPVYNAEMNDFERISFVQACKVLANYPITIVCPNELNLKAYYDIYSEILAEPFDPNYFKDLSGYNQLMLSSDFYIRFKKYSYILLYQLDAYVFRDELEYWCGAGYDYIGAPWLEGWHNATKISNFQGVGNGGLSLRNVSSILNQIKILKQLQVIYKYQRYNWWRLLIKLPKIIFDVISYNSYTPFYRLTNGQEDYFWCIDMGNIYMQYINNKSFVGRIFKLLLIKKLHIPEIEIAMKFSMECQPARLYELNNNRLPFGCHAWFKYDYEFWKPFISGAGYELP